MTPETKSLDVPDEQRHDGWVAGDKPFGWLGWSVGANGAKTRLRMAATIGLVLDCADPDRLAAFWSAALGYTTLGGAGSYVMLVDPSGQQPKLLLQRVSEAKRNSKKVSTTGKNCMHLDIETAAVDNEVTRLEDLGGQPLETEPRAEHGTRWVIMADPEGSNEFCVRDGGHPKQTSA